MYIALTEEYGVLIRKTGLSVIQFKYCMRKCMSTFTYLFEKAVKIFTEAIRRSAKSLSAFGDEVKLAFHESHDFYRASTTLKYRFVKFLSKLGYDKRKMWIATRHTWLARSNC